MREGVYARGSICAREYMRERVYAHAFQDRGGVDHVTHVFGLLGSAFASGHLRVFLADGPGRD